jgi:hypothetical protein
MPQLDSVTFLSQVFWVTIGLFALYLIIVGGAIPSLGRVLKVRAKKLIVSRDSCSFLWSEQSNASVIYDALAQNSFQESSDILMESSNKSGTWVLVKQSPRLVPPVSVPCLNFNWVYLTTVGDVVGNRFFMRNVISVLCIWWG